MSTAVFRASTRGARRSGHKLSAASRQMQTVILDEFAGELAPRAVQITRAFAPHRSGRLERGLKARVRSYGGRITVDIESTARSDAGYNYLPVTRFGHRVAFIYAKRAKALRIPLATGTIFRTRVRGYRPGRDWARAAFEAVEVELDRAAERLGRAVDRRLL